MDNNDMDYDIFNYLFVATEVHFDARKIYHKAQSIPELEKLVQANRDSNRGQITEVISMEDGRSLKFTVKLGTFTIHHSSH
jgi:hypothetical protein